MESKEAASVLIGVREKYPLTPEEREAVSLAIGTLSWTMLGESRMKNLKKKREQDFNE